jgi:predicted CoA-binding protein
VVPDFYSGASTMAHDSYTDDELREILTSVRVVAMVGISQNWNRPSQFVMKYLQSKGYRVIPVNPGVAGQEILKERVYASVADIPSDIEVDMVDMFRKPDAAQEVAEEAIARQAKVLWMQLGIRNDAAAAQAEAAGLRVVMNRCPKIEFARLFGEIGWQGVNSGVLTSRRRPVSPPRKLM